MQEEPDIAPVDAEVARQQLVAARVEKLSRWLDGAFRVPGTRWRFGWDVLLGLVPVAGDALSMTLSGYIIWQARLAGAPSALRTRMLVNAAGDFLIGLVPGIGDLLDVANRANLRNLRLLQDWLQAEEAKRRQPATVDRGYRVELMLALLLVLAGLGTAWCWTLWG